MNDLPCYVPYEPRIKNEKQMKFSVCKCGHYWHRHTIKERYGVPLFIISLGHYGAGCDLCQCDMYHFLGKFTFDEQKLLKPCKDSQLTNLAQGNES